MVLFGMAEVTMFLVWGASLLINLRFINPGLTLQGNPNHDFGGVVSGFRLSIHRATNMSTQTLHDHLHKDGVITRIFLLGKAHPFFVRGRIGDFRHPKNNMEISGTHTKPWRLQAPSKKDMEPSCTPNKNMDISYTPN